MDYSYIFRSAVPDYAKFASFGFEKCGDAYICKKSLSETGFYVKLLVKDEKFTAEVYESADDFPDSKYALFDVESANGSFVSQIRSQVQGIVEDIVRPVLRFLICMKNTFIFWNLSSIVSLIFPGRLQKIR